MKIMKYKTNILLQCLMALTVWAFVSCDDTMGGDADATSSLNFPADTVIVAVPREIVAITFDVAYNWKVTSNKEWCLVDGEKTKYTSGKPGVNTVKYVIGDAVNPYVGDEAVITMTMEGTSSEVAHIVCRPTKEYGILVKDKDRVYANGESIIIGTSGELELSLDAPFKIEELTFEFPTEWLDVQIGDATMTLHVKEESLRYIVNNELDSLCLFKENACRSSFHIQYEGMNPFELLSQGQLDMPLIVSRDANKVTINDEPKEMPTSFAITALNDDYQVVSLSYDNVERNFSNLLDEERWFDVVDDELGNVILSVQEGNVNEGNDRIAYLWAFPKAISDSLERVGFEAMIDSLYSYEMVNGMMAFAVKESFKQYFLAQIMQYGPTDITIESEAQWGLKVAVDGKTYTTSTLSDTLAAPLKAKITTEHGYQLVYVSYDNEKGCVIIPEEKSWLDVTDDESGNIEVSFKRNTGSMRTAYLLALPKVLVAEEENLSKLLFEVPEEQGDDLLEIRTDAEKYLVAQFIQDAEEESSMRVIDPRTGWKYLAVENVQDEKWLNIAAAKGIDPRKVFRTDLISGVWYVLNPLLSKDVWSPGVESQGEHVDRIEVYGESGVMYTQGKTDGCHYEEEPDMQETFEGEYVLMNFKARYEIEEEYYIIYFVSADDTYLKALVVYNYWPE